MSITRKVLTAGLFAATILCGSGATILATSSSADAAPAYSYGGVRYAPGVQAYTFRPQGSSNGNVTFFGARPTTLPSHSGQMGNVTYLGGVQSYTYRGHSGQVGNVTYFGYRPAGTVPVHQVPTPNVIRIR